jgi:hypothetical protein
MPRTPLYDPDVSHRAAVVTPRRAALRCLLRQQGDMMKRLTCQISLVPAVLALLCFSGPVMASEQVPFQGTLTGFAIPTVVDPCTNTVPISGEGQATHLGRFTWASTHIVEDLCTLFPGFNIHDDTVTLTAANGDQLFGTGVGTGFIDLTDPSKTRIFVDMIITVTGGTGRFVNSTGIIKESLVSKVYERVFLPDGTPLDPIVATLEGTLSSVGPNQE